MVFIEDYFDLAIVLWENCHYFRNIPHLSLDMGKQFSCNDSFGNNYL